MTEKCVVCKKEVDWDIVVEEFEGIFEVVDIFGEFALTEQQQMVYHGKVCSINCYQYLD